MCHHQHTSEPANADARSEASQESPMQSQCWMQGNGLFCGSVEKQHDLY